MIKRKKDFYSLYCYDSREEDQCYFTKSKSFDEDVIPKILEGACRYSSDIDDIKRIFVSEYAAYSAEHTPINVVTWNYKSGFSYSDASVEAINSRAELLSLKDVKSFYNADSQGGFFASAFSVVIMDYLRLNREFEKIDEIMSKLDANMLSSRSLISILRSTYSSKAMIPHWDDFYSDAYNSLQSKGIDPVRKLRGLKKV